jgi:hypothetical protein
MKIQAPGLNLDMALQSVIVKNDRPVVVCRVGAYDATAMLTQNDVRIFLRQLLRPSILWAVVRLAISG